MKALRAVVVASFLVVLGVIAYDLHRVANLLDDNFGPAAVQSARQFNENVFKDWAPPSPAPHHAAASKSK